MCLLNCLSGLEPVNIVLAPFVLYQTEKPAKIK